MSGQAASRRTLVGLSLDGIGASTDSGASGVDELVDAARRAEALGFDLIVLDDPLERAADGRARVSPTDALAFLARRTTRIGLLATARSHYREPFHVAKEVATVDFISSGRAGLLVDPTRTAVADAHFPQAADLDPTELVAEAAEFAEVVSALWDSWEDGAEIREAVTGRYVDNTKIHHIDHSGRYFTVKGPLITPRPPQGQPPLFLLDAPGSGRLAALPGHRIEFLPVPAVYVALAALAAARATSGTAAGPVSGTEGSLTLVLTTPPQLVGDILTALEIDPAVLGDTPGMAPSHLRERLGIPRPRSRYAGLTGRGDRPA
ncbi:LLM class flavin-dependent oxidoreductase [Herbiconiux moechotypicola]|uniref:Luciferase-like domain-containing protein n=1 Tax=Herbiconiux moechotypicola TaxID=637393 RepID=A0ABP5Q416_9MICO|nr:LLM class flavin-dependent oxidoreductase [Herbiconiux moechotypicola]MCS5728178.1 LLM class flavin-dependent oxidoreductase [Herbiconiux moechotypicola]